jgi:CheY-like chemotaxis protein
LREHPQLKKILIVDDQIFNIDAMLLILKYKCNINTDLVCDKAMHGLEAVNIV